MSTPSTVTALHPQSHFYPHYQEFKSPSSSQRQSNLSLGRPSRLAHHTCNNSPGSPADRQLPPLPTHKHPQSSSLGTERQNSSAMVQTKSKKRTDWREFYKNGLPKEIIVIDDSSPEPTSNNSPSKRSNTQHDSKRRRTDAAYDSLQNGPPKTTRRDYLYDEANSSGTNSSGRNTSTLYSTAPTSLTSTSSSGHQLQRLDDSRIGQKRKRLSRPAFDEESPPELEVVGQNQAWTNYVPPPNPPIKAGEVYTPVIRDVCST